jgi:hypothetical protein
MCKTGACPSSESADRRQMFNRAAAGSIWSPAAARAFAGGSMGGRGLHRPRGAGASARGPRFRKHRFIR